MVDFVWYSIDTAVELVKVVIQRHLADPYHIILCLGYSISIEATPLLALAEPGENPLDESVDCERAQVYVTDAMAVPQLAIQSA